MNLLERERQKKVNASNSSTMDGMGSLIPIIAVAIIVIPAIIFIGKSIYAKLGGDSSDLARKESGITFVGKGKRLDNGAIATKKTELETFFQSGTSYRMEGSFEYGYNEQFSTTNLVTKVSMFYNAENNVYKFVLSSLGSDAKLKETFSIPDGTYYVVQENGKAYLLSDIAGKKTAVDISQNNKVYNFVTSYCMEKVMYTGVMDRSDSRGYTLWGTDYYDCYYPWEDGDRYSNLGTELKVYKGMPLQYAHRIKNAEMGIGYIFAVDFFYDEIPNDKPVLAEYQ